MVTYRIAIMFVGATLVLCVVGIIALAVTTHPVPDILQNIASGSLAGLIGLLVTPAQVVAVPTDPDPHA